MKENMKNAAVVLFVVLVTLSGCQSEDGWTPLFNGENLDGWHIYNQAKNYNGWVVQDQVLAFDPSQRTEASSAYLVTDNEYTNFEISFEWMIGDHGNSGFFWGVVEDATYEYPYQTGPEIQILDDNWTEYIEERGDINRAGSLYALLPPSKIVSKPANTWNHYLIHIDHNKNEGFVKFNDELVLEFPVNGPGWEKLIAASSFANAPGFGAAKTGRFALQDHGSTVAFKNIRIREL